MAVKLKRRIVFLSRLHSVPLVPTEHLKALNDFNRKKTLVLKKHLYFCLVFAAVFLRHPAPQSPSLDSPLEASESYVKILMYF